MAHIEEVHEHRPNPQVNPKKKKGPPPVVKYYLVVYNVLSALGWSYVLLGTLVTLLDSDRARSSQQPIVILASKLASFLPQGTTNVIRPRPYRWLENYLPVFIVDVIRRATNVYSRIGIQTAIIQSFASLEILHALFGWVGSSPITTGVQVWTRLEAVWGIAYLFPQTQTNPIYASMVLSWSITEVIRYTFYALTLVGYQSPLLLYLRYTTFYLLYPTGASSEAFLILSSLPSSGPGSYSLHDWLRASFFVIWWPGLYVLYNHMIKQRRKVLGGGRGRTLGQKPKTL